MKLNLLVFLLCVTTQVHAEFDLEKARLANIIRQLDMIEHMVAESAILSPKSTRYHFDYKRFRQDLRHMKAGITDYITPKRAQPRDTVEFSGYIHESMQEHRHE